MDIIKALREYKTNGLTLKLLRFFKDNMVTHEVRSIYNIYYKRILLDLISDEFFVDGFKVKTNLVLFGRSKYIHIQASDGLRKIDMRVFYEAGKVDVAYSYFQDQRYARNIIFKILYRLFGAGLRVILERHYYLEIAISLPSYFIRVLDLLAEAGFIRRVKARGFIERIYIVEFGNYKFIIKVYGGKVSVDGVDLFKFEIVYRENAEKYGIHNPSIVNIQKVKNMMKDILCTLLFASPDFVAWKLYIRNIKKNEINIARAIALLRLLIQQQGIITREQIERINALREARILHKLCVLKGNYQIYWLNNAEAIKHFLKKLLKGIPFPNLQKPGKSFISKVISVEVQEWYSKLVIESIVQLVKFKPRSKNKNATSSMTCHRRGYNTIKITARIIRSVILTRRRVKIVFERLYEGRVRRQEVLVQLNEVEFKTALQLLEERQARRDRRHIESRVVYRSWVSLLPHLGYYLNIMKDGLLIASVKLPLELIDRIDIQKLEEHVLALHEALDRRVTEEDVELEEFLSS